MAVVPGPASAVLRFLRGGCGTDCLCGRLCDACRTSDCQPSEATVLRVTPERVVLTDGRVFPRPGGSAPRPGQRVIVDCRPGLTIQTPMQRHVPVAVEETPFISTPSWDTPQRPGFDGYLPDNDADGTFLKTTGALGTKTDVVLENATTLSGQAPRINHEAGWVEVIVPDAVRTDGYSEDAARLPLLERYAPLLGTGAQNQPQELYRNPTGAMPYIVRLIDLSARPGGRIDTQLLARQVRYADGQASDTLLGETVQTGRIMTADFDILATLQGKEVRLRRKGPLYISSDWRENSRGIERTRRLTMQVEREDDPTLAYPTYTDRYFLIAELDVITKPAEDWGSEWPGQEIATLAPLDGLPEHQIWDAPPPSPQRPAAPTFVSPDGQVRVAGADTDHDPADLSNATLTAYGQTFSGGTWTALRDNPVRREDGTWDFAPLIVLHESGDTVTAVRPGGQVETADRATFAREALRIDPAQFVRFSSQGAGWHSWPPQWAYAGNPDGGAAVAMVAWDAWRDSVKHPKAPTLPPGWVWRGRPTKRPKKPPANAPRPPLGISLAGGQPAHPEMLKKGEGPLLLPVQVEVQVKGEWEPSDKALAALAKRQLYQSAKWPEELNDSTGVRGPVRVTFAATQRNTALWLRLKTSETAPVLTVEGQQVTLKKLGHNAYEKRGYHPYLATFRTPLGDDGQPLTTFELAWTGKLTRLLMAGYADEQQS